MGLLQKSDLLFKNEYSWNALIGDDPRITGEPDSTLFNRNEGYEVLYLIKTFFKYHLNSIQPNFEFEFLLYYIVSVWLVYGNCTKIIILY